MTEPALPPLGEVIRAHGLAAKRGLGQHFLLDLNLTRRIARTAGPLEGVAVVEIGPGPGGLTRALLETAAARVVAVERDPRCIDALAPLVAHAAGRLELVEADARGLDLSTLAPAPRAVVANLPYNVATPLLIGWLRDSTAFQSLTLMFQREVADRLAAAAGSAGYGRLSVITQWRCRVDVLFGVPARAFTPPPKVASAVVRLVPHPTPEPAPWSAVERVTAAAFGQRRKMLRTSLKPLGAVADLVAAAGVSATARAEEVPVAGFLAMARALSAVSSASSAPSA